MLLHPDGKEEVLVDGRQGLGRRPVRLLRRRVGLLRPLPRITQPAGDSGADIYKVHVKTQEGRPADAPGVHAEHRRRGLVEGLPHAEPGKTAIGYGVFNLGPCPLPGGRVVFTSNRNGFKPPRGYPPRALQLFVMDDDGDNVEWIGHLNLGMALHPVVLKDGRVMFSSLEIAGAARQHRCGASGASTPTAPTGTRCVSALRPGRRPDRVPLPDAALRRQHRRRGVLQPEQQRLRHATSSSRRRRRTATPAFGPAYMRRPAQPAAAARPARQRPAATTSAAVQPVRHRVADAVRPHRRRPGRLVGPRRQGLARASARSRTPPARRTTTCSPSGRPARSTAATRSTSPAVDGGIYLIKDGKADRRAGPDAADQERPEVQRAVAARRSCRTSASTASTSRSSSPPLANDGKLSQHLPEGTPFGLVGTSSLYKRESFPYGVVPPGSVTATFAGDDRKDLDRFTSDVDGRRTTGACQGADAGLYANDDIHAIRILAMEPTTDRTAAPKSGRLFHNHASERLRILGEIPVRKFDRTASNRLDPDGNPDTSFLAKIPADVAVHVPDARQGRHGAEHGADVAPGPARRGPQRLRRLPRPQPEADRLRADRRREAGLRGLRPDRSRRRC